MFNSPTYKRLHKWSGAVLDDFILKIILLQYCWCFLPGSSNVQAWEHCRNVPFHPACASAVERSSSAWDWVMFTTPCNILTLQTPAANVKYDGAAISRHDAWCSPCTEKLCAISLVCSLIQPADREAESVVPNVIIDDCEGVLAFIVL